MPDHHDPFSYIEPIKLRREDVFDPELPALPKFEFRGGLAMWQPLVWVERDWTPGMVKLMISIKVPNRMDAIPIAIGRGEVNVPTGLVSFSRAVPVQEVRIFGWERIVGVLLREVVLHELDESLWIDGKIVRDPHG